MRETKSETMTSLEQGHIELKPWKLMNDRAGKKQGAIGDYSRRHQGGEMMVGGVREGQNAEETRQAPRAKPG